MSIDIVKRLRHTEEETATIGQELIYLQVPVNPDGPEAANEIELLRRQLAHSVELGNGWMDEIKRLNTMMNQHAAEDTEQFYGLHATIRENHEIIKILCDHIEYLGYFIDEEFQSNEPNYKYAHFVEVVNHIRDWSKDLKKDLA
jgi:hypothetical protein